MKQRLSLTSLAGVLLLSSCAAGPYVPRIRDVKEQPIDGNYWYQQFTLFNPADSTMDCPITRTGQKLDLNSASDIVDVWRKSCRPTENPDQRSDSN